MNKLLILIGIFLILINHDIDYSMKAIYIIAYVLLLKIIKYYKKPCKINKTYYINVNTNNKFVKYMATTLDYILKNRKWEKLDKNQVKNEDKIGFVFSNIDKKSTLKSQINFRVQTQNSDIFTDKVVFKEYFKNTDYFLNYHVLNRSSILENIELLYKFVENNKSSNIYYIIKDPYGSLGKQIILFDHNNKELSYKKKVIDYISNFESDYILLDEYLDSIEFKVPELSFNHKKINFESKHGRRSLIRFYVIVIIRDKKIEIYRVSNLFIYLAVIPSNGNISNDVNKFGSFITNYYLGTKLKDFQTTGLNDNELANVNLFRELLYDDNSSYNKEIITKLFCISNSEFIKQYPDKFKDVNDKVNDFINKFSDIYHDEFSCKNDKCLNSEFNSCFNIYAIDSILTKTGEFKILEINNSPGNIMMNLHNKIKKIYNTVNVFNDIFDLIENPNHKTKTMSLISSKERHLFDKSYYLSENQVNSYPEMINNLKKRNYLRSLWSTIDSQSIDLYLGYIIKHSELVEEDKDLYIDYISSFLDKYSVVNKIEGAIFELGDKSLLYNHLSDSNLIPEFVSFSIFKDEKDNNYIKTSELLQVQTFMNTNVSRCSRFILKPSLGSQGDGIEVIKYYEQFNDWFKKQDKYLDWTISEFLVPKLLISRKIDDNELRKVHLRSYFIIINDKYDNTKVYELNKRLVYFAVDKYIPKCVTVTSENKYSFITNLALASEERNIDYDTSNYTDDLSNYQDQIFNFKKMSSLITEYGLKCIDILDENKIKCLNRRSDKFKGCYQILAIDYLPVNKNDLKLLEVNKGPGFKGLKVNFNLEQIFDEIFKVSIDKFNGKECNEYYLKYLNRIR